MNTHKFKHREILERIAYRAMLEKGLFPIFPQLCLPNWIPLRIRCQCELQILVLKREIET